MASPKSSSALLAEFIGTFALIFIGAGVGALGIGGLIGVAFAHGLVVLGFAYAYGHLSGTHINPAVTIGLLAAGKIDPVKAAGYVVMQLLGALAGAASLSWLIGNGTGLGATTLARNLQIGGQSISISAAQGAFIEAVLTFFLVTAVLHCAVSGKAGNLAGVAIGMTLVFAILFGGPLTGASLNPARTLGPAIVTGNYSDLWVYLVGPIAGAVLAALAWRGMKD